LSVLLLLTFTSYVLLLLTEEIAKKAKKKDIVINAIAMMSPSARDAMGSLAEITGGQFSMVDKSGKTKVLIKGKEDE
jgi:hypothetical protein